MGLSRFTKTESRVELYDALEYESIYYFNEKSPHSSYLGLFAETGIIGSLPYVLLLLDLLIGGIRSSIFYTKRNLLWPLAMFIAFLMMSYHMSVLSALSNTSTWLVYGLIGAVILGYQRDRESNKLSSNAKI